MALKAGDTKLKKEARERKAYEKVCANSFAHAQQAMREATIAKSDTLPETISRFMVCRLRMPWPMNPRAK